MGTGPFHEIEGRVGSKSPFFQEVARGSRKKDLSLFPREGFWGTKRTCPELLGGVGGEDLGGGEVFEWAGEDVAVEDDEVGVVAGGE